MQGPMEHRGVRVELTGTIEAPLELGGSKTFLSLQETVCGPGVLPASIICRYPFDFAIPSTAFESCEGQLFKIRYKVTAKVLRRGLSAIILSDSHSTSRVIWVTRKTPIDRNLFVPQPQQCFVGTDDASLQVSIVLNSQDNIYSTLDTIDGKIEFLARQKLSIVSVELQLVRRETIKDQSEASAIIRHQVIDGIPSYGDSIKFKFPLINNLPQISSTLPLNHTRSFSVDYSLAIVLIEEGGGRSYYKQLPIHLIRAELCTWKKSNYLKGINSPYSL